jgi:hypothetical protein
VDHRRPPLPSNSRRISVSVLLISSNSLRLAEHAVSFGAASRLPVSLFPIFDARDHAGDFGN